MKSSVGVTICAVLVLIGSVLGLVATAGALFMFMGPLSGQLLDPANLPPGANVGMMRAVMLGGALFMGAFAAFGVATGIGLIRLWKWARYAAIALGILVLIFFVLPGFVIAFVATPPPTPVRSGANVAMGIRLVIGGFYAVWAAIDGIFIYVMVRKSTIAQFNGGSVEMPPRARPLSVSIIAWFMIVTAAMSLPMMAMAHLPAFVLGLLLAGGLAKAYYIVYFSLFALLGIGLLKRTSEALTPAIGLHIFAIVNALVMGLPSVWLRYQEAIRSMSLFGNAQAVPIPAWMRLYAVGSGVLVSAIIVFFLSRARRSLPAPAND
jgi:hypothetical protein